MFSYAPMPRLVHCVYRRRSRRDRRFARVNASFQQLSSPDHRDGIYCHAMERDDERIL